ncbi:ApeA N-terminal domain 1-containing protein [Flindersiella endophytica]
MVGTPRLDVAGEWTGHWWLPDEPDRAVPGVLRYDPDEGLWLSLIGGFEDRVLRQLDGGGVAVTDGTRTWSVIWGIAENKEITLFACFPISSISYGFGSGGPHKQTISALTALVGVHLEGAEDEVFTSSLVSVENMNRWSGSSVFSGTIGRENQRIDGRGTISVEPVNEPSAVVDGMTITLCHEHTLPHFEEGRGQTIGRMKDTVFVQLQPESAVSLSAARDLAKVVQDLVSLATHRASAILWLRLRMPPEEQDQPEGYPTRDREVAVYFQGIVGGDADAKAVDHHAGLFTCHHIPFEEIVPRWWRVRERLLAASNMVLGLRYAPARYIEGNLLTAVGAAEVMHRALDIDETRMPRADFEALRAVLLGNTPEKHRSW